MDDLADQEDEDWDWWALSCRKPDKIPDANGNLIEQAAFALTIKSLKRSKIVSNLIYHYDSVSIELTASNMRWHVLKSFDLQMKERKERKKNGASSVPKLTKHTTVPKQVERFTQGAFEEGLRGAFVNSDLPNEGVHYCADASTALGNMSTARYCWQIY